MNYQKKKKKLADMKLYYPTVYFSKYTLLSSNWVQKIMKILINVGNKIECKYNQIGQEWGGCNEN